MYSAKTNTHLLRIVGSLVEPLSVNRCLLPIFGNGSLYYFSCAPTSLFVWLPPFYEISSSLSGPFHPAPRPIVLFIVLVASLCFVALEEL